MGVFHRGELAVQARAGVDHQAAKIASGIRDELLPAIDGFLRTQRLAAIGARDVRDAVWTSILTGPVGFLEPLDARHLRVRSRPADGDPLAETLRAAADVGLLAIDLAARKRVRLNGEATPTADGFDLEIREAFANCPKYIQARIADREAAGDVRPTVARATVLDRRQRAWIAGADTFFIASRHAEAGADVSHRGGNPGFVRVLDDRRIAWPDYSGNRMFQTLGNLEIDPRCGLVFIDFERARTLQLTGRATVDWRPGRTQRFAGAERVVDFEIDAVVETGGREGLVLRLVNRSPFNPS